MKKLTKRNVFMPINYSRTEEGGISASSGPTEPQKFPFFRSNNQNITSEDLVVDFQNEEVRLKQPRDHTFFGETLETVEENEVLTNKTNSPSYYRYVEADDNFVFGSPGYIGFQDPDSLDVTSVFETIRTDTIAIHQGLGKVFAAGSGSNIITILENGSDSGRDVTLTNETGIYDLICIPSVNRLIAIGETQISFIDPVNESVLSTDTGNGLGSVSFNSATSPRGYTRGDRVVYADELGNERIFNPGAESTDTVDGIFPNVQTLVYIPRVDVFWGIRTSDNIGVVFDGASLSEIRTTDSAVSDALIHETSVIEDRFAIVPDGSAPTVRLVDPKNGNVLDSKTIDGELETAAVGYDPTRDNLVFAVNNRPLTFAKVDYTPFNNNNE